MLCLILLFSIIGVTPAVVSDSSSIHIREVTISAPHSSQPSSSTQILSGETLQRLQSHTVADALRFFAGSQVKDYGGVGGLKTINIRSMGTNHVGVSLDGIPISNAQNGQVDLGMFSLEGMESLTLSMDQGTSIFRPAKEFVSAASLAMVTRRPSFSNADNCFPLSVRASFKTGSFDLVNPTLSLNVKLPRSFILSSSAEYTYSSGEYTFRYRRRSPTTGSIVYDTTAVRHNGDIKALRLEGSLFAHSPHAEWMFKAYRYSSHRGIPGAIVNNVWRRGERLNDHIAFLQSNITIAPTSLYHTRCLAKYARYRTHYVNKDSTVIPIDNRYNQAEVYLSSSHLFAITPSWQASIAIDEQYNHMTATLTNFARPTRWTTNASAATAIALPILRASASIALTHVADHTKNDSDSPSPKTEWTPTFSITLSPPQLPLLLRAFAKKTFRMPTFNDLYYADMGNSDLSPETAKQLNIGLSFSPLAFFPLTASFTADAYLNKVNNKIIAYPKGTQFRWTMLNLGKVEIRGIDLTAKLNLTHGDFSVASVIAYTYQEAIDVTSSSDSYYRDQIPYIPHHSGSFTLLNSWRNWGLNYAFVYTGERYSQQENIPANHVEPWYTSDLSLSYSLHLRSQRRQNRSVPSIIGFDLSINNLLDQDYDVILNYPMPGRNIHGKITLQL